MIILYQFPISHYCEKVRWALDFKGIEYQENNLLPGLHVLKTRKLAQQSCVPIIKHGNNIIQGSSTIISYLDKAFPQNSLTPEAQDLKTQALEWERYVDAEIGVHVRRCIYQILLEYPDIVIPFFTHNGPWYGGILLKTIFPILKKRMCNNMHINASSARQSSELLNVAVDKVNLRIRDHNYLVGEQFTRADLAAAALMAPLYMPLQYGLQLPENPPSQITELSNEFQDRMEWVREFYIRFR